MRGRRGCHTCEPFAAPGAHAGESRDMPSAAIAVGGLAMLTPGAVSGPSGVGGIPAPGRSPSPAAAAGTPSPRRRPRSSESRLVRRPSLVEFIDQGESIFAGRHDDIDSRKTTAAPKDGRRHLDPRALHEQFTTLARHSATGGQRAFGEAALAALASSDSSHELAHYPRFHGIREAAVVGSAFRQTAVAAESLGDPLCRLETCVDRPVYNQRRLCNSRPLSVRSRRTSWSSPLYPMTSKLRPSSAPPRRCLEPREARRWQRSPAPRGAVGGTVAPPPVVVKSLPERVAQVLDLAGI